ncbi:MAG: hypothetical protein Q8L92_16950, partial [Rubrivivax sp.]|nr:hypothetical protein [Rubrivivax sp.]
MSKFLIAVGLIGLALTTTPLRADTDAAESALRAQLETALWPGDIVRLADQYQQQFPGGSSAAMAAQLRQQASVSMQVLSRSEVRLHRSAFRAADAPEAVQEDLRRAALGDKEAAVRLARHQQREDADAVHAGHRYVGWLQLASFLGDERASYELALHFRRQDQPLLAT